MAASITMHPRYAVRTAKGWLGSSAGNDWRTRKPTYRLVNQPLARLFNRQADATKAAQAMGGGTVVLVELTIAGEKEVKVVD